MKRLFTLVTPKYRHLEGYSQLKQNSLVRMMVMAIVMMIVAPSALKANDGRLAGNCFDEIHYNFTNAANNNVIPTFGANYTGVSYSSGVKQGQSLGDQDLSNLAFRFEGSENTQGHRWWYANGGLYHKCTKDPSNRGAFMAILGLRAGDKVRVFFSGTLRYASPGDNQPNVHMVKEWNYSDGDFYTKGNNPTVDNNTGYIITSDGDLVLRADGEATINEIVIYKAKTAGVDVIKGTSQAGNPTYTCTITSKGRLPLNDFAVPYVQCSFGYPKTDFALIDEASYAEGANLAFVYNYTMDQALKLNELVPTAGTFYAFKPTASGKITVNGGIETTPWDGHTPGRFCVFKYKLNNTPEIYGVYKESLSVPFTFDVDANYIYYVCENVDDNVKGRLHLNSFTFENTSMDVENLGVVVNLGEGQTGAYITKVSGITSNNDFTATVKRVSSSINPSGLQLSIVEKDNENWFYLSGIAFNEGKDKAGTIIYDVTAKNGKGEAAIVITLPYHADFDDVSTDKKDPSRTYGHTWNFIDPRNSDSSIGNSLTGTGAVAGTTSGILSIGQYKDESSQFHEEVDKREWAYAQRQTGSAGGYHDPMYKNVFDMEGDNADMIWETEGLWFDTGTNLSCIYNEKNALAWNTDPLEQKGNPVNFKTLQLVDDSGNPKTTTDNNGKTVEVNEDPDRYVGLLPDPNGKSSFTIPCLKDGDRVLIFMKSGEATGTNGIFLKVHGALDAEGTPIDENDLYKAGGTNWIHSRYEGCYHFIKKGDGDMKFDMVGGSMCKLMYIRIYQGKRIDTNDIVSTKYIANADGTTTKDAGHLLFINDKDATEGDYSQFSEHYSGKGQNAGFQVLTYSGNLNASSFTGDKFKIGGTYNNLLDFKSTVGEMGVFRLRVKDLTYTNEANKNKNYVADLCDRNFTVGYRDKVDYPYTWDFTDVNVFSNSDNNKKIKNEATRYVETPNKYENTGWDISLFDENGNMKVNSGVDPSAENQIFSADKAGFGNQLWADGGVIAEMRGLWFYTDDNDPRYNDCLQITDGGLRLANTPDSDDDPANNTQRKAWWNYKMVVPSVPADAAVYLRMKRDETVPADAKSHSNIDNADVYFLASRFNFGVASAAEKTNLPITADRKNQADYSCFKVPGTTDEWIVAIKNTTGKEDHLTFTLNGWILEKVAVSKDPKAIGKTGYATESRARRIDHSLTSYFTGKDIKGYTASYGTTTSSTGSTTPDYSRVVLTEFTNTSKTNLAASTNGQEHGGCILYHAGGTSTDRSVSILDGGFHLFVPDMHDGKDADGNDIATNDVDVSNNILIAFNPTKDACALTNLATGFIGTDAADGDKILVLSAKKYKYGTNGADVQEGYDVSFVRVDPKGNSNQGASLKHCSAYIKMPAGQMKVLSDNNNAKAMIVFSDDLFGQNDGIATGIENAEVQENINVGNAEWYNLNGQKLNGKPSSGGLYIMNGKKVLVK